MNISPLAKNICNRLGLTDDYWYMLTQTLINLSKPFRTTIYDYINSKINYIRTYKTTLNTYSIKANVLSKKLNNAISTLELIVSPIRNTLNVIPIEALGLQEIPEVADLFDEISQKVPLKIPSTALTNLSGLADFDFIEGVYTLRDLIDKLNELKFRLSRAISLSNYVEKATYISDEQIKKLQNILYIIIEINNLEV
jgi:hypothetical protein